MKYVQINSFSGSWARQIVFGKHRELLAQGHDSYVFWGFGDETRNDHERRLLSQLGWRINNRVRMRLDGKMGFHAKRPTERLLKELDAIQPDVVHLHSLYGDYVHLEMLFKWLERSDCQVIWTLHDCWAFTGFCLHFSNLGCTQWLTGCEGECPAPSGRNMLPLNVKSSIGWSFAKKKELFTLLPEDRMTIQVPSRWLANLVEASFLGKYPVEIVRNDIDRTVFRPLPSDFRALHSLEDKTIILGVANPFTDLKGFDDFVRLSADLDETFALVLVGVSEEQEKELEDASRVEVIGLPVTQSVEELVQIYSMADCYFNPTRVDNFPTVNLEAEACGTPVITYDVGGCRETLRMDNSFAVNGYDEALGLIRKRAWKREPNSSEGR